MFDRLVGSEYTRAPRAMQHTVNLVDSDSDDFAIDTRPASAKPAAKLVVTAYQPAPPPASGPKRGRPSKASIAAAKELSKELAPLPMSEVRNLSVRDLKQLCRDRGQSPNGNREELKARLTEPLGGITGSGTYVGPNPEVKVAEFFRFTPRTNPRVSVPPEPDLLDEDENAGVLCLPSPAFDAELAAAKQALTDRASTCPFYFDHTAADVKPPAIRLAQSDGTTALLTFPLNPAGTDLLKRACERAPFGRGTKTVVDTTVRNTLQLDPSQFTVEGGAIKELLAEGGTINAAIQRALSPHSEHVIITLYKLLFYEPGAFFKAHVDTQRSEDMFGTLVVELQATELGGDFSITHKGVQVRLASSKASKGVRFTAFFADCVHEVSKVLKGSRVALVYNLTRRGAVPAALGPAVNPVASALDKAFNKFAAAGDQCKVLGYLLSHKYAISSAMPNALKSTDAAVHNILSECGKFDLFIAPVTVDEVGVHPNGEPEMDAPGASVGLFAFLMSAFVKKEDKHDLFSRVWRETRLIDPRRPAKQEDNSFKYAALHQARLEALVPLRWLPQELDSIASCLGADIHPTGNEGTGFLLSYVHFALFIKPRGANWPPVVPAPAVASAAPALIPTPSVPSAVKGERIVPRPITVPGIGAVNLSTHTEPARKRLESEAVPTRPVLAAAAGAEISPTKRSKAAEDNQE